MSKNELERLTRAAEDLSRSERCDDVHEYEQCEAEVIAACLAYARRNEFTEGAKNETPKKDPIWAPNQAEARIIERAYYLRAAGLLEPKQTDAPIVVRYKREMSEALDVALDVAAMRTDRSANATLSGVIFEWFQKHGNGSNTDMTEDAMHLAGHIEQRMVDVLSTRVIEAQPEKTWEALLSEGTTALVAAEKALDDITGWSGGSGNWPAQEAHPRVLAAIKALQESTKGDVCCVPSDDPR